jgi:hypothetical protein
MADEDGFGRNKLFNSCNTVSGNFLNVPVIELFKLLYFKFNP